MANDLKAPERKPLNPPVIDTTKLTGATPDPRGDNNPGVLADQPGQPGKNAVTNRDKSLTAEDGVTLRADSGSAEPLNPPVTPEAPEAADKTVGGSYIEMIAIRDIWPNPGNKNHPKDEDGNPVGEWRVRAGETVRLPNEEAMDRMEAGTAERANKRGG